METWHNGKQNEAFNEVFWERGDTICCAIDIDQGEISYYLNGHFIGKAFANITFKTKRLFPVVSMFNNQRIEMRFVSSPHKGYHEVPPELYCIKPVDKDNC
eukprot:1056297_1